MIYTHSGGVEGIATDLGRMLAEDLRKRLDMELYQGRRTAAEQTVQSAMSISIPETETVKAERSVPEPEHVRQQPENRDAAREEKAQPVAERQETGTHEPEQAPTVQLTLFDLWEYTEEERNQALSGKKKKSAAKSKDKNGKKQAQVTPKVTDEPAAAPAVSPQKETEGEKAEDVKAEDAEAKETAAQAHPDDIYADIDWEENPPINGFYETMMHLTPEVRIQLRHEAEKHRQELLAKSGMKDTLDPAFVPSSDSRPVQQADMTHGSEQAPEDESPLPEGMTATAENPSVQSGQTGTTSASLFPEYDTEPAKEEAADLTPHPYSGTVEAHHRDGSMVAEGTTVGYLRDITPYGATFHPLDLKGYQKEKALLYISIRDAYERLYRNEAENRTEDSRQREYLNVSYDEFVMRYGNLNARQNAKLLMMDASGRDVLALERAEEGKFVKADIFERPVSFSVETYVNAGSPEEALSASLNRYGGIDLDFMRAITDSTEEELLGAHQGLMYPCKHLYLNALPLAYIKKPRDWHV